MVTEHAEEHSEGQMELPEEDEEDLCKVWDMAMDEVKYRHPFSTEFRALLKLVSFKEQAAC